MKRKELKKEMKKNKKKTVEDDTFEELGGWVGHLDPTKFTSGDNESEWKKPGKKIEIGSSIIKFQKFKERHVANTTWPATLKNLRD